MKKMMSMIMSCAAFLSIAALPAAAEDAAQPVRVNGAMECGLAVRIEKDADIRQIGSYPVTTAPEGSAVSVQLTPFAAEKQQILDEIHALSETGKSVTAYETYCGTAAVVPKEKITDQVYYLSVSDKDAEQHYRRLINLIAENPEITYLGKAVRVTQCDRYSLSNIQVYAPVSDAIQALVTADTRFALDTLQTEMLRQSTPDVYVLKSAKEGMSAIPYADYLDYKAKLESQTDAVTDMKFSMLHVADYCSGCQVGLEIYPPKEILGDLTGDESIDSIDAQVALNSYTAEVCGKPATLTPEQQKLADVNADGKVNLSDVQNILRYYVRNSVAKKPTTWEQLIK